MAIQVYMDHNVPRSITDGLKARGVDIITSLEDGTSELVIQNYWIVRVNWDVCYSLEIIIYCKKLQSVKELGHLSMALSMLTNWRFNWRLHPRLGNHCESGRTPRLTE